VGRIGERLALRYLRSLGYSYIEKNFRLGRGEIDLIMSQANELVFVEVKTRQSKFGGSFIFDSISQEQQYKLTQTAKGYIRARMGKKWQGRYRFDAVGIIFIDQRISEIKIFRNFI